MIEGSDHCLLPPDRTDREREASLATRPPASLGVWAALARERGRFLLTETDTTYGSDLLTYLELGFRRGGGDAEGVFEAWSVSGRATVLRLDFSRLYVVSDDESIDIVGEGLKSLLAEALAREARAMAGDGWEAILDGFLASSPEASVVLLIDRADVPLLDALADPAVLMRIESHYKSLARVIARRRSHCRLVVTTQSVAFPVTSVEGAVPLTRERLECFIERQMN